MNKVEEIIAASKLGELLNKQKEEEKKSNKWVWALAIIGGVVVVAGIAIAAYKLLNSKCCSECEDDFEDDFDEDFFENEEDN